ncbi:MAG: aldolase/citrate lyase family protein [Anaerolineaceae bacterium]|nr:aldolase/citrate lyase family protein [Anaerolineaceae bacterium]
MSLLENGIALRQKLAAGERAPGAWVTLTDPAVTEVMAGSGLDWVLVDTEHAPFSPESLASILMAFEGTSAVSLVRVGWNDQVLIKTCLDMGFGGVLVPQVASVEEAQRAVAACRYPPQGIRGFGPRRASYYGRSMDDYVRLANSVILAGIQIEHINAVNDIENIFDVEGVDFAFLGPMDLSASMGLLETPDHPDVIQAMERVIEVAVAKDIPIGVPLPSDAPLETVLHWAEKGSQLVSVGLDLGFMTGALMQALGDVRRGLT